MLVLLDNTHNKALKTIIVAQLVSLSIEGEICQITIKLCIWETVDVK